MISLDQINPLTLNVGLARHDGDWNWKNVQSPFSRVYLVTEGVAHIILPSGKYKLTPGKLYLIPANTIHSYECTGIFTHYYLHVYEEREYETSLFDKFDFPVEVKAHEEDALLMERMCELAPDLALPGSNPVLYNNRQTFVQNMHQMKQHDVAKRIEMRGINTILLSRFMEKAATKQIMKDERVKKVLEYIHAHIYDDIRIDTLAQEAFLSRGYMIKVFKDNVGMGPQAYINKVKMEKAQLMLISSDMQVKNISYTLGFSDHSYFIRLFKQITGFTPQQYRTNNVLR